MNRKGPTSGGALGDVRPKAPMGLRDVCIGIVEPVMNFTVYHLGLWRLTSETIF